MKHIAQFRYYAEQDKGGLNYHPALGNKISSEEYLDLLIKGKLFEGQFGDIKYSFLGITKLGIQCRTNTKFYLNNSNYPIVIGNTGIYELDLENHGEINNIRFDKTVLESLAGDRLLVDIVYESQGGQQ